MFLSEADRRSVKPIQRNSNLTHQSLNKRRKIMGMTSDQNENVSLAEQIAEEKRLAAKKANEKKIPCYTNLGAINLNGKIWQLLVGEDKKWYKSEWLRSERFDEKNHSPLVDIFSDEIVPLTKEEFDSYFYQKKK